MDTNELPQNYPSIVLIPESSLKEYKLFGQQTQEMLL